MQKRPPRRILLAAAAAGFVFLAGCGDVKTGSTVDAGPLDTYLTAIGWPSQQSGTFVTESDQLRENLIAECMADRGFVYHAAEAHESATRKDEEVVPVLGTREYAEQYGYGILGSDDPNQTDVGEVSGSNPNQVYVASLNAWEQAAYYEALYGPTYGTTHELQSEDPSVDESATRRDQESCFDWAELEVQQSASAQAWTDPEFAALFVEIDNFTISLREYNPDVAALNNEWATCMAENGFPEFSSKEQIRTSLWNERQLLYTHPNSGEVQEPSTEEKNKFSGREVNVAVTEIDCDEKVDYDRRFQEINFAAQERFVEEHRVILETMLARYGK